MSLDLEGSAVERRIRGHHAPNTPLELGCEREKPARKGCMEREKLLQMPGKLAKGWQESQESGYPGCSAVTVRKETWQLL